MQGSLPLRWDDVRLFLALSRGGSLARAAATLGVDTSTASRRLAALEAQLELHLFDRSREGLRPTLYAERLLPDAEAMEASAASFVSGAEGFERKVEGRVRLSVPPGLADAFVVPILPALQARHPKVVLELDARVAVVDLSRREADLALRTLRPEGAELVQKRVVVTRSVLAGAPALVERLGRLRTLDGAKLLQWGDDLAHLPVARWIREHARGAEIVLVASSLPTQVLAAQQGLGLALLPKPYLDVYALAEAKVSRAIATALATLPADELWLVTHRALRRVPRVDAVWRFLDEHFARFARTGHA